MTLFDLYVLLISLFVTKSGTFVFYSRSVHSKDGILSSSRFFFLVNVCRLVLLECVIHQFTPTFYYTLPAIPALRLFAEIFLILAMLPRTNL